MENNLFTNSNILSWLKYYSDNTKIDLERVKILDITRKNKNLIPTIESHACVMVFTEAGHPDIFYRMFNAGLGECTVVSHHVLKVLDFCRVVYFFCLKFKNSSPQIHLTC